MLEPIMIVTIINSSNSQLDCGPSPMRVRGSCGHACPQLNVLCVRWLVPGRGCSVLCLSHNFVQTRFGKSLLHSRDLGPIPKITRSRMSLVHWSLSTPILKLLKFWRTAMKLYSKTASYDGRNIGRKNSSRSGAKKNLEDWPKLGQQKLLP